MTDAQVKFQLLCFLAFSIEPSSHQQLEHLALDKGVGSSRMNRLLRQLESSQDIFQQSGFWLSIYGITAKGLLTLFELFRQEKTVELAKALRRATDPCQRLHLGILMKAVSFDWGLNADGVASLADEETWREYASEKCTTYLLLASEQSKWNAFIETFHPAFLQEFGETYRRNWPLLNPAYEISPSLWEKICEAYPLEERPVVQDWMLFYREFMCKGNPKAILGKMHEGTYYHAIMQSIVAMQENPNTAIARDYAIKALRLSGKRRAFDEFFCGWFYGLALLRDNSRESMKRLQGMAKLNRTNNGLSWLIGAVGTSMDIRSEINDVLPKEGTYLLSSLFCVLLAKNYGLIKGLGEYAGALGKLETLCPVFGLEIAHLKGLQTPEKRLAEKFQMKSMLPAYTIKPDWEIALDRLTKQESARLAQQRPPTAIRQTRVAYYPKWNYDTIDMRLQKSRDGVHWTKGSNLTLSSFLKKDNEWMSETDRAVAKAYSKPWIYVNRWELNWFQALEALIDCPSVFDPEDPQKRIEIVRHTFRLEVSQNERGFEIHNNIPQKAFTDRHGYYAWKETETRWKVLHLSPEDMELWSSIKNLPQLPKQAQPKLTKLLEVVSHTTPVMSELLKDSTTLAKRQGDSKMTFRIQPTGDSQYSIRAFVKPLAGSSLVCEPGQGLAFIATQAGDETVQVERNLPLEKEHFEAMLNALEPLESCRSDRNEWVTGPAECLSFLEIIRENADKAVAEWPEGEKLAVTKQKLSLDALKLSVSQMGHWFEVEGKIRLDKNSVLTISQLLEKIREAKGDFIQLGEKEYVALTAGLKKQLSTLESFAKQAGKGKARVSVFNAGVLEDMESAGVSLDADEAFRSVLERIRQAEELNPEIPKGLNATLRPYQEEGFQWMARLSSWGAGALLADDMGLGKTLQTIALLLSRAAEGPALVVVPTAVLYNWQQELARFAPSLNAILFNTQDREEVIKQAKAGDVVLVTYGVLSTEIENISRREWATAVLDEAHSIKNRNTKMSKAAMQIKSAARIMLTGTPLQNHLSELWNLFEFANPGLLGSFLDFSERYVIPIEKNHDRERQRLLKRLIAPFILRRTKDEVLEELPQKTEITVKVELSEEERALYERLREQASVGLESGQINTVQALSELMNLRQAACNPRLVDSGLKIPSSKTTAFMDLVEELRMSGHRALVFSQFTSHLALIKEALDARSIPYLYLDGSMGSGERQKLVERFQKGDAPLFLISLKAGGIGLNLTAADYIIHLDPWWNPSVEDQASDRAYRIGQQKPVTIYRLIAQKTIEEKIIRLHATKKSLADALLEGTDMSNRLSRDEILNLLASADNDENLPQSAPTQENY